MHDELWDVFEVHVRPPSRAWRSGPSIERRLDWLHRWVSDWEFVYWNPRRRAQIGADRDGGESLRVGQPQAVVPAGSFTGRVSDVSLDGQIFVIIGPGPGPPPAPVATFMLHFFDEVRRRVGTNAPPQHDDIEHGSRRRLSQISDPSVPNGEAE